MANLLALAIPLFFLMITPTINTTGEKTTYPQNSDEPKYHGVAM